MCLAGSVMMKAKACPRRQWPRLPFFLYFKRGVTPALLQAAKAPPKFIPNEVRRLPRQILPQPRSDALLILARQLSVAARPERGGKDSPPILILKARGERPASPPLPPPTHPSQPPPPPPMPSSSADAPVIDLTEDSGWRTGGSGKWRNNWWQQKKAAWRGKAPRSQARNDKENRRKWKRRHGLSEDGIK